MASRAGSSRKPAPVGNGSEANDVEVKTSENANSAEVGNALSEIFSRLLSGNPLSLHVAPTLPPPEKFAIGGNYPLWETQTRLYVRRFPPDEQKVVILGLLSGEAAERAYQSNVFDGDDLDQVFRKLRDLLDAPLHPIQYCSLFYAARQHVGEPLEAYAFRLKQLVQKAFPTDGQEYHDRRAMERFIEGVENSAVKRSLIKHPKNSFSEAIELAVETEKLERATRCPEEHCLAVKPHPRFDMQKATRINHGRAAVRGASNSRGRWYNRKVYVDASHERSTVDRTTKDPHPGKLVIPTVRHQYDNSMFVIDVDIESVRVKGLVDTGASKSLLDKSILATLGNPTVKPYGGKLCGASGEAINTLGSVNLRVRLSGATIRYSFVIAEGLTVGVILGADLLRRLHCTIDMTRQSVTTGSPAGHVAIAQENRRNDLAAVATEVSSGKELELLIEKAGGELTTSTRRRLQELILEYSDVFMTKNDPLGRTNIIKHQIDTGEAGPIRLNARRIPACYESQLGDMINEMLKNKVIQPSKSPWAAPIVLVKKKDGSLRLCVDYRKLNELTKKDRFPLPIIEDIFDALSGAKYFSTLDLASGYWQVEIAESDREKTAFVVPNGLYEFQTMPFGLTNAPATFQRLMSTVLRGLIPQRCLVYLDDVVVHGRTEEEHLTNLKHVFTRLRDVGLKLKPNKCTFFRREVQFLGHVVSESGIRTDEDKVTKVRNWPQPQNETELRSFLGLASYYRRFVQRFAEIAAPLSQLLRKGVAFQWTEQCSRAFEAIRDALCTAPILALPDLGHNGGKFILDTDASDYAIGAVLSQLDDKGNERVIAYGSRTLSQQEKNYCTTRKEMLALIFFLKKYRHYLLGRPFLVRTDHQSLLWLQNFRDPEGQVARWQEKLQEYDFACQHREGKKHVNADALSRIPQREHGPCPSCTQLVTQVSFLESGNDDWEKAQSSDPDIKPIYSRLLAGEVKPDNKEVAGHSWETRCLWAMWSYLRMEERVLYFQYDPSDRKRVVVPRNKRDDVLHRLHSELGHAGVNKMDEACRKRFWWPDMKKDIRDFSRNCTHCDQFRTPFSQTKAPLTSMKAGFPNEIVGVDIVGPLSETARGNRFILVMVDYFTKWCEAVPLDRIDAQTVASSIMTRWVNCWGAPCQLHSDQGTNFESTLVRELCRSFGIDKTRTTAYYPQGNGQTERTNRTLINLLKAFVDNEKEWDVKLGSCLMAYRASVHTSTGETPSLLWTGRELRLPSDLRLPPQNDTYSSAREYVVHLRDTIRKCELLAREHLGTAQRRQKDYYDKTAHVVPFAVNDKVWLKSTELPTSKTKFASKWKGPYIVERIISDTNCAIRGLAPGQERLIVVHVNRLKLCTSDARPQPATDVPSVGCEVEVPAEGGLAKAPGPEP